MRFFIKSKMKIPKKPIGLKIPAFPGNQKRKIQKMKNFQKWKKKIAIA